MEWGPVDAFDMAHDLKIKIDWTKGARAERCRNRILLPLEQRITRTHGLVAHELAHILLDAHGVPQSEEAACYLGAALLAPRRWIDRQLRAGWDLYGLMARNPNASAELLARRVLDLRSSAALTIYDAGRVAKRIGDRDAMPENERALVDEVLGTGSPVRIDDLTGAWPVFSHGHRRVVVLSSAA